MNIDIQAHRIPLTAAPPETSQYVPPFQTALLAVRAQVAHSTVLTQQEYHHEFH